MPSGRMLAYLYPEVHTRVSYRFAAINEHDKPCMVMFPAKPNVPMYKVRYHAEKMAQKARCHATEEFKLPSGMPPDFADCARTLWRKGWATQKAIGFAWERYCPICAVLDDKDRYPRARS